MLWDFPPEERKPLSNMERMMEEGRYEGYGMYREETLLAYTFLVRGEQEGIYLLDYFAVCRDGRGKGTGSLFLNELYASLRPKLLILEVEDADAAKDEEEVQTRKRRLAFYHRNQIRDTALRTWQFGVDYVILYRSDEWEGREAENHIFVSLDELYRYIFWGNMKNPPVSLTRAYGDGEWPEKAGKENE